MVEDRVQRRLAAILAADVVGYSRLMGVDEESTLRTLQSYREIIDRLIARHEGRIFTTGGDSVLAEFASSVEAVRCAIAIQEELTVRNTEFVEDRRMHFRIGINIGDVMVEGDNLFGDGVNVAARLESIAEPGGICISGSVFDQVRNKLSIGFEDIGSQKVKNIAEPISAYRLVPGERLVSADATIAARPSDSRRWLVPATAAIALVIIVAGGLAVWRPWTPTVEPASVERMASALPDKPSIAVLPFNNMSDDPGQEYFADGMSEDLITDLSKISGLFVIARNSSFVYKNQAVNVKDVGNALGVRYVLEGSVRKLGDKVRINAQLIDAETGGHLWADRFDRDYGDVFKLQNEVIRHIVSALEVNLRGDEETRLVKRHTDSVEAYDLFLKGQREFFKFTHEGNIEARRYYRLATERDPNFARAFANLGWTHARDYQDGWSSSPEDSLNKALALANDAASIDDSVSQVHWVLGQVLLFKKDYEGALAEAKRTIELSPSNPDAKILLARILAFSGNPKESIRLINEAMIINPYYPMQYLMNIGIAHFASGEYDKAEVALVKAINRNPEAQRARMWLVATYANSGQLDEANWALEELMVLNPSFSVEIIEHTIPFRDQNIRDRLANGLRIARN
jgi:adenylate cyclase